MRNDSNDSDRKLKIAEAIKQRQEFILNSPARILLQLKSYMKMRCSLMKPGRFWRSALTKNNYLS